VQGGVKRGRDEYERRERVVEESEEPAAPLPGADVRRNLRHAVLSAIRGCMCCPVWEKGPFNIKKRGHAALLSAMVGMHHGMEEIKSVGAGWTSFYKRVQKAYGVQSLLDCSRQTAQPRGAHMLRVAASLTAFFHRYMQAASRA